MGVVSSHMSVQRTDSTDSTCDSFLPEDILVEILSFVPAKDLLKNCIVVCHQWRELISSHGVWKRKCLREEKVIPPYVFEDVPRNYYRFICLRNPYGRNLLKNPCGKDSFHGWYVVSNGGDGWKVEDPPAGADPVPAEVGSTSCVATSYDICEKYQVIDLLVEGIAPEVLDNVRPPIEVSEWHAARFDCGSCYSLAVKLLDENKVEIDKFDSGKLQEEQWTGSAWSKVSHTFKNYRSGLRFISFLHTGSDTQFWAGHFGCKMTGGSVKFKWD